MRIHVHTDEEKPILGVVFTIVKPFNGKRVFEHCLCQLKAHIVSLQVGNGLGVVPFKFHIYDTTGYQ